MQPEQKELQFDERFRQAEQYSLDLPDPATRTKPPPTHEEKTCGRLGYCYCPKCHSK